MEEDSPKKPKSTRAFIWMIRHGQAEGNTKHILNGSGIDAPLTSKGKAQAKTMAKEWPWKPDAIVTSPLTRAVATAYTLADRFGMKMEFAKLAQEQDYGDFTGKTLEELMADEKTASCFHVDPGSGQIYTLRSPHGESWEDLKKRAEHFFKWADSKYAGRRIVVVSHSDFINCAYGVRFGLEDEYVWQRQDVPNCKAVRL